MHPSMQRLYAQARDAGDASPARVAERINVSPQRLQNWEKRGISESGALSAQRAYGYACDANWLLTGVRSEISASATRRHASQTERHDPALLRNLMEVAEEVMQEEYNRPFSIDAYPGLFLDIYLDCAARGVKPRSLAAKIGAWMALRAPRGNDVGSGDKTGTKGDHPRTHTRS